VSSDVTSIYYPSPPVDEIPSASITNEKNMEINGSMNIQVQSLREGGDLVTLSFKFTLDYNSHQ